MMSTEEKTTIQKMERIIIVRKKINKLYKELNKLESDIEKEINEED